MGFQIQFCSTLVQVGLPFWQHDIGYKVTESLAASGNEQQHLPRAWAQEEAHPLSYAADLLLVRGPGPERCIEGPALLTRRQRASPPKPLPLPQPPPRRQLPA